MSALKHFVHGCDVYAILILVMHMHEHGIHEHAQIFKEETCSFKGFVHFDY